MVHPAIGRCQNVHCNCKSFLPDASESWKGITDADEWLNKTSRPIDHSEDVRGMVKPLHEELMAKAEAYLKTIPDAADVETEILMVGFVRCLMGTRSFIDLQSLFAFEAGQKNQQLKESVE